MAELVDYMEECRTMPEASFSSDSGERTVTITKLGGGTIGRKYSGKWIINQYVRGDLVESMIGDIIQERNHLEVAVYTSGEFLDD